MKKFIFRAAAACSLLGCSIALGLSASAAAPTTSERRLPRISELESKTAWNLPLLPDTKGQIHLINPYRQPNSDYSAGHRGVDYRAPVGSSVIAASKGSVAFVGAVAHRRLITIRHEANRVTEYEPVCSELSVGDLVEPGQVLGFLCNGSPEYNWHCGEPCLHFSLRHEGAYFSPLALIGGLAPSRLLPLGRL